MSKLNDARRSLEKAKQAAQNRLQKIEDERREIKQSMKSLDAALRVLVDSNRPPRNPPSSAQLATILLETLRTKGPTALPELRKAIGLKLAKQGMSSANLQAMLEDQLKTPKFSVKDGLYALKSDS